MAKYRLLQVEDSFINNGKPFYKVQKKILGLWWSEYFEEHYEHSATFYDIEEANKWYDYHLDKSSRTKNTVLKQNFKETIGKKW